jgi:hypothetical protein
LNPRVRVVSGVNLSREMAKRERGVDVRGAAD